MISSNTKSGFVYVLSNDLDSSVLKIGYTTRTPEQRCAELNSQTGVFFKYSVEHKKQVKGNAYDYERLVHREFRKFRISPTKEHFRVDLVKAIYIVEHIEQILEERAKLKRVKSLNLALDPVKQAQKKFERAKRQAEKKGRSLPENFMKNQIAAAKSAKSKNNNES